MTSPSPSEPRTGHQLYHGAPFTPATAAKLTAGAIVTIYATQIALVSFGTIELVASSIADILVIALVVAVARRHRVGFADLGLRDVPGRFVAAGVLVGMSAWYLTMWIVALIEPPGDPSKLQALVTEYPLVPTLLALTIMPALAEELVFRGVLVRSLAGRFFPAAAIGIGAVVFAAYHLFPPQMLTTFLLAILLGFMTLRARSIVPSVIAHTLNNTVAVLLARDTVPGATNLIDAHPLPMLAGAVVVLACGIALASKGVV